MPNRYIPKDIPSEDEDWLNVFIYLDSDDKLIATTEKPKVQVGEFASLKVVEVNSIGVFLDWGLPKDLLLPYSEEKRQLSAGEYCVVHVYLDKHTSVSPPPHAWIATWIRPRPTTRWARKSTCW